MRVLIDECLDWRLCRALPGHSCRTAQQMGWAGLANGDLLRHAQVEFDAFITGDRNLAFQQSAENYDLAILILHANSIQLAGTEPLMPRVLEILKTIQPGTIVDIYP